MRRPSRRARELGWLQTHRNEVRAYAGQWIVLEGEEIIAHGPDPAEVVRLARERGVRVPLVLRIESDRPEGAGYMGL